MRRAKGRSRRWERGELVTVKGVVSKLFISRPKYSAGRLRLKDGDEIVFSGRLMVAEGDPLELMGVWIYHSRFGPQLGVISFEYDVSKPTSPSESP